MVGDTRQGRVFLNGDPLRSGPFGFGVSLLDDFLKAAEGDSTVRRGTGSFSAHMPVNVREEDQAYVIEVAVPGMKKSDLHISVDDGKLSISAQCTHSTKEVSANTPVSEDEEPSGEASCAPKGRYSVREWSHYKGSRILALPADANAEAISASLSDGVLSLRVEKVEEQAPKRIDIS
ncbi:Hsp20/alpha crystallin family protein [bacterium]|nr:Hsp20/alpha crystallin family protein [bacterium]